MKGRRHVVTAADIVADLAQQGAAPRDPSNYGPVVLMDQDETLTRLVATWPNVSGCVLSNLDEACPEGMPEHARLRWLWTLLEPDPIPLWICMAGLPHAPHIERLCWLAIDNRIVLPDGTISTWAEQYLSRNVAGRM